MEITLKRVDSKFQFQSGDQENRIVHVCGSEELQGSNGIGQRPMELLLNSLAACLSIDVLSILYKQKQDIKDFKVNAKAIRKDAIPAIFEQISLEFVVFGNVKEEFLSRAIALGIEKYCSVYHSLAPQIKINTSYVIREQEV